MGKKLTLEDMSEGRFVIALPTVDMDVPQYDRIRKIGGSIATTPAGAVSHYVFRLVQNQVIARTILANIRDRYGGAKSYAMRIPEEYTDENNVSLTGNDKTAAEEIELSSYFAKSYGGNPRDYLDQTRRVLSEFKRIRKK